jgi:flagellar biosynthetic protein FlhB
MAENKDGTEKTEDASAKRLTDAREKGQVAKSVDVTTAGIIMVGGILVFTLGKTMLAKMRAFFSSSLGSVGQFDFTDANVMSMLFGIVKLLAEILLPLAIILVIIALSTEISQVGLKIATKK